MAERQRTRPQKLARVAAAARELMWATEDLEYIDRRRIEGRTPVGIVNKADVLYVQAQSDEREAS